MQWRVVFAAACDDLQVTFQGRVTTLNTVSALEKKCHCENAICAQIKYSYLCSPIMKTNISGTTGQFLERPKKVTVKFGNKTCTVARHIYEDLGQAFFLTKVKVSGIYCSLANEDITMNPKANNPNFIQCSR